MSVITACRRSSWTFALITLWGCGFSAAAAYATQLGGVMPPGWCEIRGKVCEPGPCGALRGSPSLIVLPGSGQFVGILVHFRNFNLSKDGRRFVEKQTEGLISSGYSFVVEINMLPKGSEISSLETTFLPKGPQAIVATRLAGKAGLMLNPSFPQPVWGMVELEVYVEKFGPLGMEIDIRRPGLPLQKVRFTAEPVWIELYNRDPSIRRPPPDGPR